jgi:hypothetical protein
MFNWPLELSSKSNLSPFAHVAPRTQNRSQLRLPAVGTLKRYSKGLEYEYRVKTATLGTLKRYSIFSLTLYLE